MVVYVGNSTKMVLNWELKLFPITLPKPLTKREPPLQSLCSAETPKLTPTFPDPPPTHSGSLVLGRHISPNKRTEGGLGCDTSRAVDEEIVH